MEEHVERRSRARRNQFSPSKAPSLAFPGFSGMEEREEQPCEFPLGPLVPKGPCAPLLEPGTATSPGQGQKPRFTGCGD